jgi:hypothetical protein
MFSSDVSNRRRKDNTDKMVVNNLFILFNLLLTQYIVSQYNTYYTIFVWSALEDTKHTEVYPSVRNLCTLIGRNVSSNVVLWDGYTSDITILRDSQGRGGMGRNVSRNTRINKLFTTILSVLSFLLRFETSEEKI